MKEILTFPCRFPLKIIGEKQQGFIETLITLVRLHAPDLVEHDITSRDSANSRYLSVTVTINATSREQLDRLYLALTSHAMVKVVL